MFLFCLRLLLFWAEMPRLQICCAKNYTVAFRLFKWNKGKKDGKEDTCKEKKEIERRT